MSTKIEISTRNGKNTVITSGITPMNVYVNRQSIGNLTQNDYEVLDSSKGFVLRSPNGTRFRITANDDGTLNVTAL
jgi:hypothetical protein